MKRSVWFFLICVFFRSEVSSQVMVCESLIPTDYIAYSHGLLYNPTFFKDPTIPDLYKKEAEYRYSTGLYLYKDNTFIYYCYSPKEFVLSAGKYSEVDGRIVLNWDKIETDAKINDPEFYTRIFRYGKPQAFAIEKLIYFLNGNKLSPQVPDCQRHSIGILFSCKDLYKKELEIEDFSTLQYNTEGTKLVILQSAGKRTEFPADSIWGFVIHDGVKAKVYRRIPKSAMVFGVQHTIPGMLLTQVDLFILYAVGAGRSYSFFSKDLNSEIVPLNANELKKAFPENNAFHEAVSSEFRMLKPIYSLDKKLNCYMVMEMYRSSLGLSTQK